MVKIKEAISNSSNRTLISTRQAMIWADPRFRAVLRRSSNHRNGPRAFQVAQQQHDPSLRKDFAEAVVTRLARRQAGHHRSVGRRLPEQNQAAAERVTCTDTRSSRSRFTISPSTTATRRDHHDPSPRRRKGHIIVLYRGGHNLLPRVNAGDNNISVGKGRFKEGSGCPIGMVLATQAPSSVMPHPQRNRNWVLRLAAQL